MSVSRLISFLSLPHTYSKCPLYRKLPGTLKIRPKNRILHKNSNNNKAKQKTKKKFHVTSVKQKDTIDLGPFPRWKGEHNLIEPESVRESAPGSLQVSKNENTQEIPMKNPTKSHRGSVRPNFGLDQNTERFYYWRWKFHENVEGRTRVPYKPGESISIYPGTCSSFEI